MTTHPRVRAGRLVGTEHVLAARRAAFDLFPNQGRRRPGSLNPHKGSRWGNRQLRAKYRSDVGSYVSSISRRAS